MGSGWKSGFSKNTQKHVFGLYLLISLTKSTFSLGKKTYAK